MSGAGEGDGRGDGALVLVARLLPSWGFSLKRLPSNKTGSAIVVPPPTTLLGALSYSYSRIVGDSVETRYLGRKRKRVVVESAASDMLDLVRWVSAAISGEPVSRASPMRGRTIYRRIAKSGFYAVPAAFTVGGDIYIDAAYVLQDGITDRLRQLVRAARGIVRVGSKESLFSAEEAAIVSGEEIRESRLRTRFAFPLREGLRVDGRYIASPVFPPGVRVGSYSDVDEELWCFPIGDVLVEGDLTAIRFEYFGGEGVIVL